MWASLTAEDRTKDCRTCLPRSLPTPPSGMSPVCSNSAGVLIQLDCSISVRWDVVLTCAKVPPRCLRSAPCAHVALGEELEAFLERHRPSFDQIIYVGDGSNDYCPVLRLRRFAWQILIDLIYSRTSSSQDAVLCRRLKGLEDRIEKEGPKDGLKCQVHKWTGAWEVEEHFNALWSVTNVQSSQLSAL